MDLVAEVIREKIYRRFNEEVPYMVKQETVSWNDTPSSLHIYQILHLMDISYKKMLIGKAGSALSYIQKLSEQDLSDHFGKPVVIHFLFQESPKLFNKFY